ncbi:MAG: ABC transporter ATP-binding protein [Lachnospiraceae bacterium]|nr:ABC transporter ATP-binding protein [Lachnospiraceae bacterium]
MKRYIWKIRREISLELLCDFVSTTTIAVSPLIVKNVLDGMDNLSLHVLLMDILAYALLQIICSLAIYGSMIFTWRGAISFENNLKKDFFKSLLYLDKEKFYRKKISEYLSIQNNDITVLEQDGLQPTKDIIKSAVMVLIYAFTIIRFVDYRLAVLIMFLSAGIVLLTRLYDKELETTRTLYLNQVEKYNKQATSVLENKDWVNRATVRNIETEHDTFLNETSNSRYSYGKSKSIALTANDFSIRSIQTAAFALAVILLFKNEITIGTAVATFSYIDSFVSPIGSILYDIGALKSIKGTSRKIFSFVNEKCNMECRDNKSNNKEMLLENVCYCVGSNKYQNISLQIRRGEKCILRGKNGTGKTTLFNAIQGKIKIEGGEINICGLNVRDAFNENVITCINQNCKLYVADVKSNISVFQSYPIGELENYREYLPEALFEKLLKNCNGNDATTLSGGEQQLVLFARMLVQNSPIVLLDEPFSAMDNRTRKQCEEILFSDRFKDKTVIIITHENDPEFVQKFDRRIGIENGKVTVA